MKKKRTMLVSNLKEIEKRAKRRSKNKRAGKSNPRAVALFDLTGSTKLKMAAGHDKAREIVTFHNGICSEVCKSCKVRTMKELGDGLLATFVSPLDAIMASISIMHLLKKNKIQSKSVITFGLVEEIKKQNVLDIFGNTVDRCAKIEKFALPGQIIIDGALKESMRGYFENYEGFRISKGMTIMIKDHGNVELFEISSQKFPLKNYLNLPFKIHESGRLQPYEKIAFMETGKKEIIEIGSGIREFTRYFTSRSPEHFREPVKRLLKKGLRLHCYAVDPDWILKSINVSSKDKSYYKQIPQTLKTLYNIKKELADEGLGKQIEIYTYQQIPMFHALGVDIDSKNAKMIISNYLPGINKAECPVMQFSRSTNPTLFARYKTSIEKIIENSKKWHP